ncbi:hypothetical protein [Streptomyces swartbergensis]|nr:hypothetical protein [Streptomyces swartbergensis]
MTVLEDPSRLPPEGRCRPFRETEERVLHLKTAFYDQFLSALDRVGAPQS